MKSAYILHGCLEEDEYFEESEPSPSNAEWFPWLQKQLLLKGYLCQTPEMPSPHKPEYGGWRRVFEQFPTDCETTVVAHSCGCGFVLRFLGEAGARLGRLVLVAPWLDPQRVRGEFLNFTLDPELAQRLGSLHVLYAPDDPNEEVRDSIQLLEAAYPALHLHAFPGGGHFALKEMGREQLRRLLDIVTASSDREA